MYYINKIILLIYNKIGLFEIIKFKKNQLNKNNYNNFINIFKASSFKEYKYLFIRKYASYIFMDNVNFCLSNNSEKKDIHLTELKDLLEVIEQPFILNKKTIFITHPHKGNKIFGQDSVGCNDIIINKFKDELINLNELFGVYISKFNIAFIYGGNHSISIASIKNDIIINSNKKLKNYQFNNVFYTSIIEYDKIIYTMDNEKRVISITDWKIAAFFKMLQLIK